MSAPIPRPVVRGELPGINLPRILTHRPLRRRGHASVGSIISHYLSDIIRNLGPWASSPLPERDTHCGGGTTRLGCQLPQGGLRRSKV